MLFRFIKILAATVTMVDLHSLTAKHFYFTFGYEFRLPQLLHPNPSARLPGSSGLGAFNISSRVKSGDFLGAFICFFFCFHFYITTNNVNQQ